MVTVVLTILFFVLLLVLPTMLQRRALGQVVNQFRKHQAVGKDNAKTRAELGLEPPGFQKRLISLRDYKPRALDILMVANIVQVTEAGKMYLSEEKLMNLNP